MKNTKTCPKCQSKKIVRFDGGFGPHGGNVVNTSFFSAVVVHKYICCNCGLVEEWIDREDLEEVAKSKNAMR